MVSDRTLQASDKLRSGLSVPPNHYRDGPGWLVPVIRPAAGDMI